MVAVIIGVVMSYQVLARKYRPQAFRDVVGQEHITRTLQNAIEAKRLHHAYLFTGVRGVGKTTVARILAKALNCEGAPATEPCNKCRNCINITEGAALDVQEIDGASNTGVDDVREIRERLKYLPSHSRYKIYIIDEVHMLSTAAFNALLKTLEEPPPHVVFLFATTEPQKIPATILSRCQRHDFRRIPVPVLIDSVKKIAAAEKVEVEPDAVAAIAIEAEGSMRDAQSLFDQAVAFSGKTVTYESLKEMLGFMDRAQIRRILTAVAEKDCQGALGVVEEVFNQGGNLVRLAQEMLAGFRSILVFSATSEQSFLKDLPGEEREFITGLASKLETSSWEQVFKICYRQAEEVARSRYPKMVLEALCIQLTGVRPVSSVDSLLERVDKLLTGVRPEPSAPPAPRNAGTPPPGPNAEEADDIPNPAARAVLGGEDWKRFVGWLSSEKPQLFAILEHGIFVGSSGGTVNLQYSEDSVYGEMLKEEHRKRHLEDYIEKYFKKRYAVDFQVVSDEVAPTELRRAKRDAEVTRRRQLKEETLAHEIVKEAASVLEADIKEIKIKE